MNASVFGNKITRGKSQPVENTFLDFDLQKKGQKKIIDCAVRESNPNPEIGKLGC